MRRRHMLGTTLVAAIALILAGCTDAVVPRAGDRGNANACYQDEHRWELTWEPIPGAVNYNLRLHVWQRDEWRHVASVIDTEGEPTWTSNYCTGSFSRIRYKVRAVYADESTGTWSPWVERTR